MSFTSQKEFFNVPFRNEDPKLPDRKRSDGALMTYDLCTDGRAWALDKQKRSNYILDVVHKARFKKVLLHPEGQFELTKDYLIHLDPDDLADYILSLQAEIKRKNDSVQALEESRKNLGEQLEMIQKQSDELIDIRKQSAILEQERNDFEQQMEDLEMVIVNLKDRADRYDLLCQENEYLRKQLQYQRAEAADRIRLINAEVEANFNRMRAEDCEKLEAELILFKSQYDDLRHQKRELKEQLQQAFVQQSKLTDLKRQLALEQSHREKVEEELEHVLSLYDQRFQEVDRSNFASIEELEIQRSEQLLVGRSFSTGGEVEARRSSATAEFVVEGCDNCHRLKEELESLRRVQMEELQDREHRHLALQEQVESLRKELDLVEIAAGGDEQASKLMEDLINCREEIRVQKESEQDAQARIVVLEDNLARVETKLEKELKKTEQLEATAEEVVSNKAEFQESIDDEFLNLKKSLEDAQTELAQKIEKLDFLNAENIRLQAEVAKFQENVVKLETIQQQQLIELETSKSELVQTKEHMASVDGAELDNLKKMNDELQREVERLQKKELTYQSLSEGPLENAESQSELQKLVDTLRAELQGANETMEEREKVIERLRAEADLFNVKGPLSADELSENDKEDRQIMRGKIEELEKKLQQCEGEQDRQVQIDEIKGDDLPQIQLSKSKESIQSGNSVLSALEENMIQPIQREDSIMRGSIDKEAQAEDEHRILVNDNDEPVGTNVMEAQKGRLQSAISEKHITDAALNAQRLSTPPVIPDVEEEHEDEVNDDDADKSEENAELREIDAEENVNEPTGTAFETKKRSIAKQLSQKQMAQLDQTGFLDDDIIRIGISDPDKTRTIAIKIIRHGIRILVITELNHLHEEICRAIIERYLMLGHNVKAIDNAMCECNKILHSVKNMSSKEMNSMLASPATQVPIRNPFLVDNDIPVRMPNTSKARPKSTSFTMGQQGQKAVPRILVGDYNERPRDPFGSSIMTSNIQGRVKVDVCHTRPWRAPKTPTETVVANTLEDGSRVITRQKRYF